MNKLSIHAFSLSLIAIFSFSCASIISGTTQAVTIDCNVPGASVQIEGNLVGVTPFTGKIKRRKEAVALVSMDGYVAQPLTLTTSFNAVAILSLFWDYSTTDCLTGAVWEYAPNSYYVNLAETDVSAADFRRESSLLAFAMTYHGDLQTELAAGTGPKLRTMHDQFASSWSFDEFRETLRSASSADAVHFGEAVSRQLAL
jgi:hypothetical protein